mgnify:CR=1 FL=1
MSDERERRRRERLPSAKEQQLWDMMTRDVTPLSTPRERPPVDVPEVRGEQMAGGGAADGTPVSGGAGASPARSRSVLNGTHPGKTPAKPSGPPRLHVDDTAGVDRRTADRLKRGRLGIDARIDLHGMTRHAAQDALLGFIDRAHAQAYRCVLVITGKGSRGGEAGVLRSEVPRWLNLPHVRKKVVAVTQAQQRHGGGGAYYVLLRRRRGDA